MKRTRESRFFPSFSLSFARFPAKVFPPWEFHVDATIPAKLLTPALRDAIAAIFRANDDPHVLQEMAEFLTDAIPCLPAGTGVNLAGIFGGLLAALHAASVNETAKIGTFLRCIHAAVRNGTFPRGI